MRNFKPKITVFTIGHSTRTLDELITILDAYGIKKLIDVRTIPKSRHNPQFNKDNPEERLGRRYMHIAGLGGLRHAAKDSLNTGCENASFRGYADYMQTEDFAKHLTALIEYARKKTVAIMCAKAVPWRCHRSLIGDALLVREIEVIDIYSATNTKPHKLTEFARVEGTHITYPPQ